MILIVGATGNIGREVLRLLSAAGQRMRIMVRDPEKSAKLAPSGADVEFVKADLGVPASLDAALKGVRKAFLVTPVDHRAAAWQINFIEAARRAGTAQLVKCSVMGADSHSNLEVLRQHGGTDQLLTRSGIGYTILRPNAFFQNLLGCAEKVRTEGKLFQSINHARVSMLDVRDIAEVVFKTLTTHGHVAKTYTLTGPEAISYDEVAIRLEGVTSRPVRSVYVPPETARKTMIDSGLPLWNSNAIAMLFASFAEGHFGAVTHDLEHVLGRTPRSIDGFLRDFGRQFW